MSDECKCKWCKTYQKLKDAKNEKIVLDALIDVDKEVSDKKKKNADKLLSLVEELFDKWTYVSDDLSYLQVIFDGSWPSAVKQLEEALENAKKIQAEQDNE